MQVLLVRHAQPNIEFNPDGPADPALSDLGRAQALRLNDWLAHEPIDLVVTSPKRRAIETVSGVIGANTNSHRVVGDFDEVDRLSHWYYPTELLAELGGTYWDAIRNQRWDEIGWDPPEVFHGRVIGAWEELVATRPADHLVLACHGGVVRRIVAHVLGLEGYPRLDISYTSISRVDVGNDGVARMLSVNETGHLDGVRETFTPQLGHRTH